MSRKGNGCDHACVESFHSLLKKELVYQEQFRTREEAKHKLLEYIEIFYNRQQFHSALGYQTPVEYEHTFTKIASFSSIGCFFPLDRGPELGREDGMTAIDTRPVADEELDAGLGEETVEEADGLAK